jgi:membrane-associated phospholipid phosphatase
MASRQYVILEYRLAQQHQFAEWPRRHREYITKHWTPACAFLFPKEETQMVNARVIVLAFILGSAASAAQEPLPEASTAPQGDEAPISAKQFVTNILKDQKPIFTFPLKAIRGNHWKAVLGVTLVTGGLVTADPYIEPFFRERSGFDSYKTGPLRGRNTTMAVSLTPVAFYVAGLATHSRHAKNTGLLAAEALVDTQLLSFVGKQALGRLAPSDIPPHGNYRDTWFKYQGGFTNKGSFPSGHTASAFAIATVIAERYPKHSWVPWISYGTATVLSLSRLPTRAHFSSDIFIGAALGYSISHFVVLRQRE